MLVPSVLKSEKIFISPPHSPHLVLKACHAVLRFGRVPEHAHSELEQVGGSLREACHETPTTWGNMAQLSGPRSLLSTKPSFHKLFMCSKATRFPALAQVHPSKPIEDRGGSHPSLQNAFGTRKLSRPATLQGLASIQSVGLHKPIIDLHGFLSCQASPSSLGPHLQAAKLFKLRGLRKAQGVSTLRQSASLGLRQTVTRQGFLVRGGNDFVDVPDTVASCCTAKMDLPVTAFGQVREQATEAANT